MKPGFRIIIENIEETEYWKQYVSSIILKDNSESQKSSGEDSATILISDPSQTFVVPEPGRKFEIHLGYETDKVSDSLRIQKIGIYYLDAFSIDGPPNKITLKFKASKSGGINLETLKERKTRTHEAQTLGNFALKISKEHKLGLEIDPALKDIQIATVQQTDESDSNILHRVSQKYNAIFKIANDSIIIVLPGNTTKGKNIKEFELRIGNITSWSFDISKRPRFMSCSAKYIDKELNKEITITLDEGKKPATTLRNPYPDKETAINACKSELEKARKEGVTFTARFPGSPDLFAGARVKLIDIPYKITDMWQITEIEHTLTSSGYQTSISGKTI